MKAEAPKAPGVLWHERRTVAWRGGKIVERFERCAHDVLRFDRRRVFIDCRCGGGGPEVELRRDRLALDLGVRAKITRDVGGAAVDDAAAFFEGVTPGWRSPSSRSEAGVRAAEARARGAVSGPPRPPWKRAARSAPPPPPPPPSRGPWRPRVTADDLAALGLTARPGDLSELKRAWRAVAQRTHPDHGGDAAEFIAAREAYERVALAIGGEVSA